MNIKENYQQYVSRYAAEVAALKRKNTGFITGELQDQLLDGNQDGTYWNQDGTCSEG